MHPKLEIPKDILDRVMERRGTPHIHAAFDPATTALIVVDLQNAFMVKEHAAAYVPEALSVVPNVNRLAAALRSSGGKVFWIRNTVDEQTTTEWSHWFAMTSHDPEKAAVRHANMAWGAIGHELHPDLDVHPTDAIVYKRRFSALIQGSSDLHDRLRSSGIETVLITGTVTNVCCESTARDAMMLNYKTIMVEDANAALSDREHHASLLNIYATFGDVLSTDELISLMRRNVAPAVAE
ncbi:cysteine hydrolase [Hoeflea sp.]|uniref:cysteine hydrolase n=1 Tax=Hoeflea sp. TaxID=1940281 RepID=UPI0019C3C3C1|nr:cysteine hydrolase [Hoeflea sp.]MBC7284441.1 cysteine hydrolase [Hoeflea sp.]